MLTPSPADIECPTCHAPVGQPCVRITSGAPMTHFHWGRSYAPTRP